MDALAEAGFHEIELMVTRDPKTQEPDIPLELARQRGLQIASVHGPFLVITKNVWTPDPLEKIRRGVELCKVVGASTFIVHPPFLWERAYARWLIQDSQSFSTETGVIVAVETMYPKWVAGRRLRGYRWLDINELFRAAPSLAMDTSHLTVARQDILDAYQLFGTKLVHIHLSNNAGDGRDGHLELEQGILPIETFLDELRQSKYAGTVALEVSVARYLERHKELIEMLQRNRQYVEDRLSRGERLPKGRPRS